MDKLITLLVEFEIELQEMEWHTKDMRKILKKLISCLSEKQYGKD